MIDEPQTPPTTPVATPVPETDTVLARDQQRPQARDRRGNAAGKDDRRGRGRSRGGRNDERARSEFDQKVISLRRVARVVAGGRRFSFSAAVIAGDKKGRVGVGLGKGMDTALALDKAFRDAKRNMIKVALTDSRSIPHDVSAKYASATVALRPSPARGIVAGSSVRVVLELAGITDITAKLHSRSKNKLNNARAAVVALTRLRS